MKKLILADYLGICDEAGNPIGHTMKVLREYAEMLSDEYDVILVSGKSTNEIIDYSNSYNIPYTINLNAVGKKEKIKNIYKRIANIKYLFTINKDFPIWICSTDFYIFLYLFFSVKVPQKLILTIYKKNFDGEKFSAVKNFVYKSALKKVSMIVCSDMELDETQVPVFHMPDYLYKKEYYEEYSRKQKQNKVICLGTMGKNKLLDELIEVFCQNGYPLEVIGKFSDLEQYQRLRNKATSNIKMENGYISAEEYMELLSSAKYSILPYDMSMYKERTSGVILETIFVGTIPIASNALLDFMKIPGIGYDALEELMSLEWTEKKVVSDYVNFVENGYSIERIGADLVRCFNQL